jgi:mxaK protein
MASRIKMINLILGLLVAVGIIGSSWEAFNLWESNRHNEALIAGKAIKDEAYPLHEKFSAAYYQGETQEFKHAIQTYNQIVESEGFHQSTPKDLQSSIYFNVGNNLFSFGLLQGFNEDGSIKEEGKHNFLQAKSAYEQALRMNPDSGKAKFNLSLLNLVIPLANQSTPKDKSGVELSNLPIGLP